MQGSYGEYSTFSMLFSDLKKKASQERASNFYHRLRNDVDGSCPCHEGESCGEPRGSQYIRLESVGI